MLLRFAARAAGWIPTSCGNTLSVRIPPSSPWMLAGAHLQKRSFLRLRGLKSKTVSRRKHHSLRPRNSVRSNTMKKSSRKNRDQVAAEAVHQPPALSVQSPESQPKPVAASPTVASTDRGQEVQSAEPHATAQSQKA